MSPLLPIDQVDRDATAVSDARRSWSWQELDDRSHKVAKALSAYGIREGSCFGVLMRNRLAWVEVIFGTILSGRHYIPINWHLTPNEIAYIMRDSGANLLLHDAANFGLAQAAGELVDGLRLVDVEQGWEHAVSSAPTEFEVTVAAGGVLLFTGGTTGRPKAVIRSEVTTVPLAKFAEFSRGNALDTWHFPNTPGSFLSVCPLYHSAPPGLLTYALLLGNQVHILDRFDAEATLAAIERLKITSINLVPTQIIRLLRLPREIRNRYDLPRLTSSFMARRPAPSGQSRNSLHGSDLSFGSTTAPSRGRGPYCVIRKRSCKDPGR